MRGLLVTQVKNRIKSINCNRCSGRMFREANGDYVCINCGHLIYRDKPLAIGRVKGSATR